MFHANANAAAGVVKGGDLTPGWSLSGAVQLQTSFVVVGLLDAAACTGFELI